jgi:hypothetical protein
MRDFRDAKAMARTLRDLLSAKGLKLSHSESLELTAKLLGERDWNTIAAAIEAAKAEPPAGAEPAPAPAPEPMLGPRPVGRGFTGFSAELETSLHRAVAGANRRRHSYVTLEHLLQSLLSDADARSVLEACNADLPALDWALARHIDSELGSLVTEEEANAAPTAGFHRVVQRAVIHVQASGREFVTGANLLVAIFSERESRACGFLEAQGMNRYDAVNFIAHGVRKDGKAA